MELFRKVELDLPHLFGTLERKRKKEEELCVQSFYPFSLSLRNVCVKNTKQVVETLQSEKFETLFGELNPSLTQRVVAPTSQNSHLGVRNLSIRQAPQAFRLRFRYCYFDNFFIPSPILQC